MLEYDPWRTKDQEIINKMKEKNIDICAMNEKGMK